MDLLLATIICLVVHEAGHAIAAYALGWRVAGVRLKWYGPALDLRVKRLTNRRIAVDVRWMAAAGPVANFLLAIAAVQFDVGLAVVSLICGLLNLLPFKPADGYVILKGASNHV